MTRETDSAAPVVSVVIATYNRRDTVSAAIDSVLVQDGPPMEVLVVDDGSTDGTAEEIARRYSDEPSIRVISRQNGGPAAARNAGISEARGEFLALLDSDDVWLPSYVASQLEVLRTTGADLVLANASTQVQDGTWKALFDRPDWKLPDSMAAMWSGGWALPTATMMRTEVAKDLRFDESFRLCDDLDFMIRFNQVGYRCVGNPKVLAEYRAHPGQLSADRDTIMLNVYRVHKHHSDTYRQFLRAGPIYDRQFGEILMRAGRPAEAYPHLRRFWLTHPFNLSILQLLLRARSARSVR